MTVEEYDEAVEQVQEMKVLAENAIARSADLKWLYEQEQFQRIMIEGYCKEYPKEIAEAIATNTGGYDEDALIADLKAVKHLTPYFIGITNAAEEGERSILSNAQTLAEMAAELEEA